MRIPPLAAIAALSLSPLVAATPPGSVAVAQSLDPGARSFQLYDGSTVSLNPDGIGEVTDASGNNSRPFAMVLPEGQSALGDQPGPSDAALLRRLTAPPRTGATGDVIVGLSSATFSGTEGQSVTAQTTDPQLNAVLRTVGATSARPLFSAASGDLPTLSSAASNQLGTGAVNLSRVYTIHVRGTSAAQAAQTLARTPGVTYAEPDQYVSTMNTDPVPLPPLPQSVLSAIGERAAQTSASGLPTNFGLSSSLQSYLNANGVDLGGGYSAIEQRLHQLPGTGEIITNVSLGDLTDQSMADAGDAYVRYYGPTTIVSNGQRYLDYPSLPLIPTYTVSPEGSVDPLGSVERVDPYLGEVLLDFSVMAPLPDGSQRPDAQGSGLTDLLGIAPGASYRLVEPQQPTTANIAAALLAAAQQTPRPNVITASLGFGTDSVGFPGRYLEDDPLMNSIVAAIVHQYGITVTISSNDGTRMYTPAPVGPDGGSTATNLAVNGQVPTSVGDDSLSTTPSIVRDSGAISVGGTTTDDTIAVPTGSSDPLSHTGTFAETRLDGATNFSSGFGTRVDVSAPSDNIPALMHQCLKAGSCQPDDAVTVLSGGTSASAPMTAAVVADLLQVSNAVHQSTTPESIRTLLERTGRAVPTEPQIDQSLHVGPQIDLTAAVNTLLKPHFAPTIVRLSVAHRVSLGDAGASFEETTDPGAIDLQGPRNLLGNTGEGLVGPITFGLDVTGIPAGFPVTYALDVNGHVFTSTTPAIRLTPTEILTAAGLPIASTTSRTVGITAEVRAGTKLILTSQNQTLTFGPSDGTHVMAPAPVAPAVVSAGASVPVRYDLTNVTGNRNPQLIVSSINHWSPFAAPLFRINYSVPLTGTSGTVTVPPSAFAAGAGIYGLAIEQNPGSYTVGAVASIRVASGTAAQRPPAPTLAPPGGPFGHTATVTRAEPEFQVTWNAGNVAGATGASLEISAPGPTIYSLLNNFTNQNGSARDNDGGDTGSVALVPLSGTAGTETFNAASLGLPSSLHFGVRVLATGASGPIGQASPISSLEYDDGVAPGGATITGFDIKPAGASTVSTAATDANGNLSTSGVYTYAPASGQYGPPYAEDTSGQYFYTALGSDPGNHHVLAQSTSWTGTAQHVLTFDAADRHLVADAPVDAASGYLLLGGRVDAQRHRLVILGWRGSDGADTLLPFDTGTGAQGSPVLVGGTTLSHRFYRYLDIDGSTGAVDLAASYVGDLCIIRTAGYTTVNLDTGQSIPRTSPGRCVTGIASDQSGHAELTIGPLYSYPMLPQGRVQQANESTGSTGALTALGANSPLFPTVDAAHGLLVVGFLAGANYRTDNNGMSGIGTYSLATGQRTSYIPDFNLFPAAYGFAGTYSSVLTSSGIQLDPTTRTGWTYGPDGTQVQQFSY